MSNNNVFFFKGIDYDKMSDEDLVKLAQKEDKKALDLVIDKLEDQIRRQKTRLSRKGKDKLAMAFVEEEEVLPEIDEDDEEIVRTKVITPEKMDLEEAIMRMELLNHSFFIYTDEETDEIAVVYKRNNGGYGCIETSNE